MLWSITFHRPRGPRDGHRYPVPPDRHRSRVSAHHRPLGRLAGVMFRRRGRTVLAWVAALLIAVALASALGGEFKADYSAPGSDSGQAQRLLEDRFASQAGDSVDVVVHA